MNTNDAQIRIYRRVTPISHPGSTEGAGWALNVLITGAVAAAALLPCHAALSEARNPGLPLEGQAVKFVGW